jgi:FkbM family methyltransferase
MISFRNIKERLLGNPLGKSARREPLYLDMLGAGLGKGPVTMVSIGSSDGVECMYALQKKGRDVTVHLLEPDPNNLELCKHNISRKFPNAANQINFHNLAVSNRNTDGKFFLNPDSPNLNSASATSEATVELPVRYVTLDHFLSGNRIQGPLIVNMDIEGHEVEVLEGFLRFATENNAISILMEVHPALYTEEHSLEKALEKYFSVGFKVAYVESAGVPVPEKFAEKGLSPVKSIKSRGLYANPPHDFVLETACHEHINQIGNTGQVTRKVVRSILIQKD